MMRIAWLCAVMVALPAVSYARQGGAPPAIVAAVVAAVRPALPYPPARPDGLPEDGNTDIAWSVRWPEPGDARIEVLANPLHAGNRERALEAERQIQAAAQRAQQRSQGDYERALRDFARTGRTDEIREISLRDDGVAGERYDAESQLTVEVLAPAAGVELHVPGGHPPDAVATPPAGVGALLRLSAHVYEEAGADGLPGEARYAAEQAILVVGTNVAPSVTAGDPGGAVVTLPAARPGGQVVVVRLSGNRELVDQVLAGTNWRRLADAVKR